MLIAAALAGDDEAFSVLVRRFEGPLLRAAVSRLGRREVAEEAVQETFLCAHRWLATYDSRYSFRTWLWTILLNQCSRLAKREARQVGLASQTTHQIIPVAPSSRDAEASPLSQLLARESAEHVHELLARLPGVQADALRLRFFGGLTFPEIAAAMQCSEAGAKNRVKTGLLKLADWLGGGEKSNDGQARRLPHESGERL
jgi:RNA polymerase sigma-70 factor, ECF subfamily